MQNWNILVLIDLRHAVLFGLPAWSLGWSLGKGILKRHPQCVSGRVAPVPTQPRLLHPTIIMGRKLASNLVKTELILGGATRTKNLAASLTTTVISWRRLLILTFHRGRCVAR